MENVMVFVDYMETEMKLVMDIQEDEKSCIGL